MLLGLLAAAAPHASGARAAPAFHAPVDDLPSAIVGDYRIDFIRNGAFVVSRRGRVLFDGGLLFASEGWQEWGTQIRRSGHSDSWELTEAAGGTLVTGGTLFSTGGEARFEFVQSATLGDNVLRLSYEIVPLTDTALATFGMTFHLPVAGTAPAQVDFWPSFNQCVMREEPGQEALASCTARGVAVTAQDGQRVALVGVRPMDWTAHDDRKWQLNTFRLIGSDRDATAALGRGEAASISVEILLGAAVSSQVPAGALSFEADRYGRVALHDRGQKIAEGGWGWLGGRPPWLHDSFLPSEPTITRTADGALVIEGATEELAYEARIQPREDVASGAIYTASVHGAAPEGAQAAALFAVPVRLVAAAPESEASGEDAAGPHVVRVRYLTGVTLELEAPAPWDVAEATINGVECYLLTGPADDDPHDGTAVSVSIGLTPAEAAGEESQ